jgi:hypothetical protein
MPINNNEAAANELAALHNEIDQKIKKGELTIEQINLFLNKAKAKEKEIDQNPWASYIKLNKDVWESEGVTVDTNLPLPEYKKGYMLLYRPSCLAETPIMKMYDKKFGDLADNNYSQDPTKAIHAQQARPQGDYWFIVQETVESDTNHRNKSYGMFKNDGNLYLVPAEGFIFAFMYRIKTGNMLDIIGWTFFHATDANGYVLYMSRGSNGEFYMSNDFPDNRYSNSGPLQVLIS